MQDGDVEHVFYKVIVGDVIVTAAQLYYVEVQPPIINLLLLR